LTSLEEKILTLAPWETRTSGSCLTGTVDRYRLLDGENLFSGGDRKKKETVMNEKRSINTIAQEIMEDWKNVNHHAEPYLDAMLTMSNVNDGLGYDSGESIILYFLYNAATWRGENARRIKAELRKMVG